MEPAKGILNVVMKLFTKVFSLQWSLNEIIFNHSAPLNKQLSLYHCHVYISIQDSNRIFRSHGLGT